ncbi:MAG: hypothetical protein V2I27_07360 [Erythrobacter sp.]|jgi:hypothetical protein|nr:hypothetical protein [Erythrobacter sp.]
MTALASAAPAFSQVTLPADCLGVSGNCSTVEQSGSGNEAEVDQFRFSNTSRSGNTSQILQNATDVQAIVQQTADESSSYVEQTGESSIVDVQQIGLNQKSVINQFSTNPGTFEVSGYARVFQQFGEGNEATIRQTTNGQGNFSVPLVLFREGVPVQLEAGNGAAIVQQGRHNAATITQLGAGLLATSLQSDADNLVDISQEGQNNLSAAGQISGISNISKIVQSGISLGNARVVSTTLQDGDGNMSTIDQTMNSTRSSPAAIFPPPNIRRGATVQQEGSDNISEITQEDTDHRVSVGQIGDGNDSAVMQSGIGNEGDIEMLASSGNSELVQRGSDNTAVLVQTANGNTSDIYQDGGFNTAEVTQATGGNVSAVNQNGSNNTAIVTQ